MVRRVTAPAAQATIGHLKAIVVLAAACCVVLTVMPHPGRHATINQLHLVAACAVVSFYFGSRS